MNPVVDAFVERLRKHTTIFYSTHILEDVQRVSDTVAILNHGELIAEAPIDQLLASGSGSAVYLVTIKGNTEAARQRLSSQDWVSTLNVTSKNGYEHWQVSVRDEEKAESQLLPLVFSDGQVQVRDFGRKQYNLEEVFLKLVEGSEHVS